MNEIIPLDTYINNNYLNELKSFDKQQMNAAKNLLLEELKNTIEEQIISEFGIAAFFEPDYKTGGNVTTVHNAKKGIYSNVNTENRMKKAYDRNEYSNDIKDKNGKIIKSGLSTKNKAVRQKAIHNQNFKSQKFTKQGATDLNNFIEKSLDNNGQIINQYNMKSSFVADKSLTDEESKKNTHIDHAVSGKEHHENTRLRLFMSDKERAALALDNKNLYYIPGRANQSKSERDLMEWGDEESKKDPTKSNFEYFNIDRDDAYKQYRISKNNIKKAESLSRIKYYSKETLITGTKQGYEKGFQSSIARFIVILKDELINELKIYFKTFSNYQTIKLKIKAFTNHLNNVRKNIISRAIEILSSFADGFISGFIANIITTIINTFATTLKKVTKIITDGTSGLIKATKILLNKSVDKAERNKMALKAFSSAVILSIGGILTEQFKVYLVTTPFALFKEPIGNILGGILTGIINLLVINVIDDYKLFLNNLKSLFTGVKDNIHEYEEKFHSIVKTMDEEYQKIYEKIISEYKYLLKVTRDAFDDTIDSSDLLNNTIKYAKILNVEKKEIIVNLDDIDAFFLN